MKKFFIIILSLFVLSCSSDSGSGGDDPGGNNGGNSGGNNGGNNGGGNNTDDGSTDPDDYTDSNSDGNTTYYVSFSSGNDTNDGKTETTPFKNLGKINSITFKAGDIVKFKKGDTWKGYFKIRGSGSEDSHISVDSYGSGNLPIIDGNGYQAGIFLENIENITISNIEITNEATHRKSDGSVKLMHSSDRNGQDERYGILVLRYGDGRNISNININNVKISNIYPTPGDATKEHQGYGIRFESYNNSDRNYYSNIEIDNVDISLTGHYGIHIVNRMSPANSEFYHRNITIKNSKFTNTGGSGIVLARCKDVLVEDNHFDGTGSDEDSRMWNRGSGLWTYTCNDTIIQENIFENAYGPQDSYGAHIDWGCERVVMQYNLSRNNFGGFVEILGENEMCGYRYNISIADGKRTGQHHGNVFWISDFAGQNRRITSNNNFIYNNTVFVPSINDVNNNPMDHIEIFFRDADYTYVYNNIVYVSDQAKLTMDIRNDTEQFNSFRNNMYYGNVVIDSNYPYNHDPSDLLNTDPQFSNVGGNSADDYKLKSGSPAFNSGFIISGSTDVKNYIQNNGGRDYFGNTVSSDTKPNVGAYNGN